MFDILILLLVCASATSKFVPGSNKYTQFNNEYIIKIPLEKSALDDVQYRFTDRHLIVQNIPDNPVSDDEVSGRNINILLPEYVGKHCNVYYINGILEIHMPIIDSEEHETDDINDYEENLVNDDDEQFNYTRKFPRPDNCGSCVCWRYKDEQLNINFTEQFPVTTESSLPQCTLEDFVNSIVEVDTSIKNFCNKNSTVSEVYGENHYILKYRLHGFEESNVNVNILHRVIQTTADDGNCETFKDLRILPDILRVDEASWVLEHCVLKIYIPYKIKLGQMTTKTFDIINENIINVPNMVSSGIQLRLTTTAYL